ncbi:MAG: flagellar basal-body MS-ring/collar protein FliF [Caldimonas sp.]
MENGVALNPSQAMAVPLTFSGRVKAMPGRAKASAAIGLVALAAVVYALAINTSHGEFRVLYGNLSDKDGGAVVAQLSQMNVPYRVAPGGAILVPAGQVPDLRLKMATAGLPKGSVSGYELMDTARFGQTQFQERLTFQRGLEGELTRSITSLAAVQNARVHLALPNQNGFFREQQKPSASVLLSLHPGRSLDRAQVAGIVHLVSSSVPELDPKAVSVLDQSGALLTGSADALRPGGLDAGQLQYLNQIETGYAKRIFELLEPIVGHDNLRATVAADVDFTQSEATSEEFKPNQGAEASISIRSQQTTEQSGSSGAMPSGVPGAASNQPPVAATAPLVGASQPLQAAPLSGGGANGRREAVTNYEVDKTVRVTRNATGTVKRLSAAVVVNNKSITDAKGKTTQVALNEAELEKLTSLVRESIGYKQDRGDSVKVINAPFRIETIPNGPEVPWWKAPDNLDLLRSFAMPGALVLVALLVFFGLVRPGLKAVTAPPVLLPGSQLNAVADDATSLPMQAALAAPRMVGQLESAKQLARQNPAAVAGILRGWVGTDQPASR